MTGEVDLPAQIAAAAEVFRNAHEAGLPMPDSLALGTPWPYAYLASLEYLTDWSLFLEHPITSRSTDSGRVVHQLDRATPYEFEIDLLFVEQPTDSVPAAPAADPAAGTDTTEGLVLTIGESEALAEAKHGKDADLRAVVGDIVTARITGTDAATGGAR